MKLQSSRLPVASMKGLLASSIAIMLTGCLSTGGEATSNDATGAGNGSDGQDGRAFSTVNVAFDPANQVLPFPTNLLFEADASAAKDGTINAPVADPEASSAALVQGLNELDGFSTIAPWRVAFTGDVDAASLQAGNTVRVFRMTTAANTYPERVQPTAVDRELQPGTEYRVQYNAGARELLIIPTRALEKGTSYTAVVTKGVLDPEGAMVGSPLQWSIAKGTNLLDQCDSPDRSDPALLQCTTNPAIAPLVADSRFGLSRDDLLLGWGVTTQQQDDTFLELAKAIRNDEFPAPINGDVKCETAICFLTIGSLSARMWPKRLATRPLSTRAPSRSRRLSKHPGIPTSGGRLLQQTRPCCLQSGPVQPAAVTAMRPAALWQAEAHNCHRLKPGIRFPWYLPCPTLRLPVYRPAPQTAIRWSFSSTQFNRTGLTPWPLPLSLPKRVLR